jgi:hypothetical protein
MAVLLHPSMRIAWLIDDNWKEDWIATALKTTFEYYRENYEGPFKRSRPTMDTMEASTTDRVVLSNKISESTPKGINIRESHDRIV